MGDSRAQLHQENGIPMILRKTTRTGRALKLNKPSKFMHLAGIDPL